MQRTIALAVLILAGVGLAALVVSRGPTLLSSPDTGDSGPAEAKDKPVAARPAEFTTWPTPAAVLVLSGEQHGYLEPCGCSEKQSGGIARRSDLMKQLRAKGWPAAGLDLGGTVKRSPHCTDSIPDSTFSRGRRPAPADLSIRDCGALRAAASVPLCQYGGRARTCRQRSSGSLS